MNLFNYKVIDADGKYIDGVLEAGSIMLASAYLKEQGYFIIKLKPRKKSRFPFSFLNNVNSSCIARFNQQLAIMLKAGIPLAEAIEIIEGQSSRYNFNVALKEIKDGLRSGMSFHKALQKHPGMFDKVMINMVEAGEMGGKLDVFCDSLGRHYQLEHAMKEKFKAAMTYPVFIVSIALISVFFMALFVFPIFLDILTTRNAQLPLLTQIVFNGVSFMLDYWAYIFTISFIIFLGLRLISFSNRFKKMDLIKLKIPIYGNLNRRIILARFCRTLGILLSAGIPIIKALDTAGETLDNYYFSEDIQKINSSLISGQALYLPFLNSKVFPEALAFMIKVGEESASLDKILTELSNFYQQEIDIKLEKISSLIEPIMIIVVGIIVGTLVLAMLLPMFQIILTF